MNEQAIPGTAVVCIEPSLDPKYIALFEQVQAVLGAATSRIIASYADLAPATDELVFIATLLKAVKAKQREYTEPIETLLTAVKAAFQSLSGPLAQADQITRGKIIDYRAENQRKRDELAAIEAKRLELANMEAAANNGVHCQDLTPIAKPDVPHRVNSYTGLAGMAKIRKWELVDKSLVPMDFLMLDTTAIGKAVRGGIGSIPGIRIWIDEVLRITPH